MNPLFFTMRALADPGPGYVVWQSDAPDFAGTDAPAPILSNTAVVVSAPFQYGEPSGKLSTSPTPVGLWLFNGDLNDSSGNDFHLTGTPREYTTAAKDRIAGAVLEAAGWTRAYNANLKIAGALTIDVIGVFQNPGTSQFLVSYGKAGELLADNELYAFYITSDLALGLAWEHSAGTGVGVTTSAGVVPVGVPTHLTATRDASGFVALYVDGVDVGTGTATAPTGGDSTSSFLTIGDRSEAPGSSYLTAPGTIFHCVKIQSAESTGTAVKQGYNQALGGFAVGWRKVPGV
jgi:hypothetical protein